MTLIYSFKKAPKHKHALFNVIAVDNLGTHIEITPKYSVKFKLDKSELYALSVNYGEFDKL